MNEATKYRPELLDTALECGAVLTGKPNGLEPITVVFSIEAWRAFDLATACQPLDKQPELSKEEMNITECKIAQEGALAYREGKGISDNPYVPGHNEPFEEANKWHSGYLLEMLRASKVVDESTALNLSEASWLSSRFPARLEIIDNAIVALVRSPEATQVYA